MLRCQPVSGAENPAAGFCGQGGGKALGVFQIAAGVTAAVEVEDHTAPAFILGDGPGTCEFVEGVVFDDDGFAMDGLHQLADLVLAQTNLLQGKALHQRPEKAQLRPNKFCRKCHWIKSFLNDWIDFII